jgi:hypothetical protein
MGQSKRLIVKMLSCDIWLCFELKYLHAKTMTWPFYIFIFLLVWFFFNLELFPHSWGSSTLIIVITHSNYNNSCNINFYYYKNIDKSCKKLCCNNNLKQQISNKNKNINNNYFNSSHYNKKVVNNYGVIKIIHCKLELKSITIQPRVINDAFRFGLAYVFVSLQCLWEKNL